MTLFSQAADAWTGRIPTVGDPSNRSPVWQRLAKACRAGILVSVITGSGCSRSSVVSVVNRSTLTISNVVVSGTGFSERIARIGPGEERLLTVRPRGESGIRVEFDAAGKHVDGGPQGYFESGGYRVTATVNEPWAVSVTSELRSH